MNKYNKPKNTLLGASLLLVFSALIVFSLTAISLDSSANPRAKNDEGRLEYTVLASYKYTAYLKPNIVYDNKSTLSNKPYLFLSLVREISIAYEARSIGAPLNGTYRLQASIGDGETWEKNLVYTSPREFSKVFNDTINLNMTEIENIVSRVRKETMTYSPSYQLVITAYVQGTVTTPNASKPIALKITHPIILDYSSNRITFTSTAKKMRGEIQATPPSTSTGGEFLLGSRLTPYLLLLASTGGLGAAYYGFFARSTVGSNRDAERKYKDIVVEGGIPPATKQVVRIPSLENLGRLGSLLEKPLIKHGDTYYVVDGETTYIYEKEKHVDQANNAQ